MPKAKAIPNGSNDWVAVTERLFRQRQRFDALFNIMEPEIFSALPGKDAFFGRAIDADFYFRDSVREELLNFFAGNAEAHADDRHRIFCSFSRNNVLLCFHVVDCS